MTRFSVLFTALLVVLFTRAGSTHQGAGWVTLIDGAKGRAEFWAATLLPVAAAAQVTPDVRKDLAPTGTLRAGVNYGNPVIVQGRPDTRDLRGVAVDLARELGRRLGVPVELVAFETAGGMADAATTGAWDVAFLAVDPKRANTISFSAPYAVLEGTYLVPAGSPLRTIEDVDRAGVRVAVGTNSAYDLYLSRTLKHAEIRRIPTSPAAIEMFVAEKLDAVAGVRAPLVAASKSIKGSRVMDGRFMSIGQGAGVPKGRDLAARYLHEFIENVKASGFVAEALKRSGVEAEAAVAPPGH